MRSLVCGRLEFTLPNYRYAIINYDCIMYSLSVVKAAGKTRDKSE